MAPSVESPIILRRLMRVRNVNSRYADVETAWHQALRLVERLSTRDGVAVNRATLYSEFSTYRFAMSQYDEARPRYSVF